MQEIIAAVDFSRFTPRVLETAAHVALRYDAQLTLFHSYFDPVIDQPALFPVFDFNTSLKMTTDVRDRIAARARAEMLEVEEQLLTEFPTLNVRQILTGGRPEKELARETSKNAYDMLVIGMRGAGNTRRALIGSVTAEVMEQCRLPILCIPPEGAPFSPKKVAFATNFEVGDRRAMRLVQQMFSGWTEQILPVHIQPQTPYYSVEQMETEVAIAAEGYIINRLEAADLSEGLDEFTRQHNADVLVMTHEQRGVIRRLFDAGNTRKVYFESRIPLLVITR
jgi:nucleotide-binding universal stress UspA family protein